MPPFPLLSQLQMQIQIILICTDQTIHSNNITNLDEMAYYNEL
ncbi:hypothetical protein ETTORE_0405 [Pseudomonas phage Ettore]|nr:hypothetical protein ETTORE_0405 [Pseudomonas phage Ettore]